MLPNFLIVGAPKSGTTSLWRYLSEHPQIFMSSIKEPHFFSDNPRNLSFAEYKRLFNDVTDEQAVGEASATYLWYENAHQKIKKCLPICKIIIILRDPAERLYSAYWHGSRYGKYNKSFESYIKYHLKNTGNDSQKNNGLGKLKSYYEGVNTFIELYGKENVYVCLFDDLLIDPKKVIKSIFGFLNVDESFIPHLDKKYNVGSIPKFRLYSKLIRAIGLGIKPVIIKIFGYDRFIVLRDKILGINKKQKIKPTSISTRLDIINLYKEDIKKLEGLINRDLHKWYT